MENRAAKDGKPYKVMHSWVTTCLETLLGQSMLSSLGSLQTDQVETSPREQSTGRTEWGELVPGVVNSPAPLCDAIPRRPHPLECGL